MRLQYNKQECTQNFEERSQTLNDEQREFVLSIQRKLDDEQGGLIFLNRPAGRGKTYASNCLLNYVRGEGQTALAWASSAIAAMNYPSGRKNCT
ncbi:hypothetical protein RvY_00110 [Ramazzottius varieornatus]|uniref:ATP-dependent DNA helicase n=1 Tax=Ramazzottius varieornatus TaxID=947166 RepID=A0A1D1UJ18_RAMVA|nr:hypothetical protein RvY_00110 [Ramazzottius varieornatus]